MILEKQCSDPKKSNLAVKLKSEKNEKLMLSDQLLAVQNRNVGKC
jgi:hypothetical protein